MIVNVYRGEDLVQSVDTTKETATYKTDKFGRRKETPLEYRTRKREKDFDVIITRDDVEIKEETNKVHYVEQTTPTTKPTVNPYRPSDFNMRVSLDSVPSIDAMYKDLNVRAVTRKGKVYENNVDMESKNNPMNFQDKVRVEDTLDIVRRAMEPKEDFRSDDENKEDPAEVTVEDQDTIPIEEESVETEGKEYPVDIVIEPRGEDLPEREFNDNKSAVDQAFYD